MPLQETSVGVVAEDKYLLNNCTEGDCAVEKWFNILIHKVLNSLQDITLLRLCQ
jgi:hypothetical protein